MSVLLQISDTHFGTEQPPVLEALVALAAQQRPDLVVLSGDITQRATAAQFASARDWLARLQRDGHVTKQILYRQHPELVEPLVRRWLTAGEQYAQA